MRRGFHAALVAAALLAPACGIFEEDPVAPTRVDQSTNVNVYVNSPTPAPSPVPSASPGSTVATSAKVTEIGGDGFKTHAVDERFTLTYTRFNGSVEVPGDPRVDEIVWAIDTNGGVVQDIGSPILIDERGSFTQVYNRDLRAIKAGTFTATASFKGTLVAAYDGTVSSASSSSYRAGGSGGGFGTAPPPENP